MFNLRKKISKQCLLYLDGEGFTVLYYDRESLAYCSESFKKRAFEIGIQQDLKIFVEQNQVQRGGLSVVLGPDQYQILMIDKPNVAEHELNQSVVWLVKDQLTHPVDEVFIQTFELPEFQLGRPKVYVVAVQKDILYALQQSAELTDLKLIEVTIIELSFAKLLEKEGHICLFYQQVGQLYCLCINEGVVSFRQELGLIHDFSKEALLGLSLFCQRTLDQYQVVAGSSLEKCFITPALWSSEFAQHIRLTLSFHPITPLQTIAEFVIGKDEFEKILPLVGEMQNATEN